MYYESTRGGLKEQGAAEVIKKGIAPNGGLYVPADKIHLNINDIGKMLEMSYNELATNILKLFLDDFSLEEVAECVNAAYTSQKFGSLAIAPMVQLNDNLHVLELWHGPTCAFKDVALQILPHLLVKSARKTNEKKKIVILTATSGDTGKAALEGFKDVEGVFIMVFYPSDGVSQVQKLQMVTQEGSNVCVMGVEGNFDDAQNGVKAIFTDKEFCNLMYQAGFVFSSANSINWGRLMPQIVYYFKAYIDLVNKKEIKLGNKVNFVVPTGNFGNILAAFYAMQMGLPIHKLICASNVNNVLTHFINTGKYDKRREFKKTISPSMDILISSNLERLLFELTEHDGEKVNGWMKELKDSGVYHVDADVKKKISEIFGADFANEEDTKKTIECIYKQYGYILDTHTAVAVDVYDKYVISTGDMTKTVVLSTASPFKFTESVVPAILDGKNVDTATEFELIKILEEDFELKTPEGLKNLDKKPIIYNQVCLKEEMKEKVRNFLKA